MSAIDFVAVKHCLDEMELQGRITIYSIIACKHCRAAKTRLGELNLPFTDVNLDDHPEFRMKMTALSGKRTVPQIFFNNKHIGGNDEFQQLSKEDLDELIEEVKTNPLPADAPPVPEPVEENAENGIAKSDNSSANQQEQDENAKLIEDFKGSGIIKDHRQLLTVHKDTFTGKDFVSWVMEHTSTDRPKAVELAESLFKLRFLCVIHGEENFKDDTRFYRLLDDVPSNALNTLVVVDVKPLPASELAVQLRKQILKLYGEFLSPDGKCVDYEGMKHHKLFNEYIELAAQLQRINIDDMSREEKLAFFINIYNALVIHGNVTMGFPTSTWQRYKFFNSVSYRIGGLNYSLQDIENGILRSNRKGVGMLAKPFSKSDARMKVALEKPEPLIHFALVCGARSCPPIKTYSANGIMDQLKCSTEAFLEGDDGCSLDQQKKSIKLSKIMDWYQVDFGNNTGQVVEWVCETLPSCEKKDQLSKMIQEKNYKVSYIPYDWGTNSKPKPKY